MRVNISVLLRLSVETMLTYTQYVECHVACKKKKYDQFHFVELDTTWHFLICIINTSSEMLCIISKYIIIIYAPAVTDYIEPLRMLYSQQPITTFDPRRLFDMSMVARFFFIVLSSTI